MRLLNVQLIYTWSVCCLVLFYFFMSSLRTQVPLDSQMRTNARVRHELKYLHEQLCMVFKACGFLLLPPDDLNAQTPKALEWTSTNFKRNVQTQNECMMFINCVSDFNALKMILLAVFFCVDENNYEPLGTLTRWFTAYEPWNWAKFALNWAKYRDRNRDDSFFISNATPKSIIFPICCSYSLKMWLTKHQREESKTDRIVEIICQVIGFYCFRFNVLLGLWGNKVISHW
jgi:hypothetical protein